MNWQRADHRVARLEVVGCDVSADRGLGEAIQQPCNGARMAADDVGGHQGNSWMAICPGASARRCPLRLPPTDTDWIMKVVAAAGPSADARRRLTSWKRCDGQSLVAPPNSSGVHCAHWS